MKSLSGNCSDCSFLEICKQKDKAEYEAGEMGCAPYSLKRAVMTFRYGTDEQIAAYKADPNNEQSVIELAEKNIKREVRGER